jgi:hypothetical protein
MVDGSPETDTDRGRRSTAIVAISIIKIDSTSEVFD